MLAAGIALWQLPQSFRDAISVTRKMQVSYIWIDSLCIKQDDPADWLNESEAMAEVYSSAYCNIAATACSSSQDSLFRQRDPERLRVPCVDITQSGLPAAPPAGNYWFIHENYFADCINSAPLDQRAWVLQKRLLAKRVLHFTHSEIMLECRTHTVSETWPEGVPGIMSSKIESFSTQQRTTPRTEIIHRASAGRLYDHWREVQRSYSWARLTFPKDRAIAIAGIARKFQALLRDEYIVGMWRRTLLTDLLWHCTTREPHNHPRALSSQPEYAIPSFSWLSLEAGVSRGSDVDYDAATHAEIISVHIDYVTNDSTGLVRSGQLHVSGPLRAVSLHRSNCDHPGHSPSDWKARVHGTSVNVCWYAGFTRPDLPTESADRYHFLLPVAERRALYGLVLELLSPHSKTYRRVGIFELDSDDAERLLDKQHGQEAFPEVYDAATLLHTICIM